MPYPELLHDAIGLYKTGRFFSQSLLGVQHENDFGSAGVGRTKSGDVQKTMRIIVLLHETSHYLHDLSLGAFMASDYILDECHSGLIGALRCLSKRKSKVQAPLLCDRRILQWREHPELRHFAEVITTREEWVRLVWGNSNGLVEYCKRNSNFANIINHISDLTGESICEGLVAAKTITSLSDRIASLDDAKYLEANKHVLHIFPEDLPPIYNIARIVYDSVLGCFLDPQQWTLQELWPLSYSHSPRFGSDIGFIYLCDIALHIPPWGVVAERVKRGANTIEDFLPAFRFCKAVDSIRRRGGFPPGNPGESPEFFYIKVFNEVASDPQLRWPTFHETNGHWKMHLAQFKQLRHEAADGYRFRLVIEREQRPHTVVMRDPILICLSQGAPIMHLTPSGFKFLRAMKLNDRLYNFPLEWSDMAILEAFHTDMPLWKDVPSKVTDDQFETILRNEFNNSTLLHQEAVYRSVCHELRSSLLYGSAFSCPFAPHGCSKNTPKCISIKCMDDAAEENCCIRSYLAQDHIDLRCLTWGDSLV
jgi:hypothetical protein